MRLYVNTKEVPLLKGALQQALDRAESQTEFTCLKELLERVILCEELQESECRAKKNKEETTMNKQTNPFITIQEVTEWLQAQGADPFAPKTTQATEEDTPSVYYSLVSEGAPVHWQEHILSINVHTEYVSLSHFFVCEIHLSPAGFDTLVNKTGLSSQVLIYPHLSGYKMHSVRIGSTLHLFKLVLSDSLQEAPNETVAL